MFYQIKNSPREKMNESIIPRNRLTEHIMEMKEIPNILYEVYMILLALGYYEPAPNVVYEAAYTD